MAGRRFVAMDSGRSEALCHSGKKGSGTFFPDITVERKNRDSLGARARDELREKGS
jgi:hypothetical protein